MTSTRPTERNHERFQLSLGREPGPLEAKPDHRPVPQSAEEEIALHGFSERASDTTWASLAADEKPSGGRALDPAEWLAHFTSRGSEVAPVTPPVTARPEGAVEPSLTELIEGWVRRVALGGDSRRGVAKLDIGHGSYAGAQLVVTAEAGHVSVELTLPAGAVEGGLAARLEQRLAARGYETNVAVR